jgi:hypothetical protein
MVVEVAEGGERVDDPVEATGLWQRAHVALQVATSTPRALASRPVTRALRAASRLAMRPWPQAKSRTSMLGSSSSSRHSSSVSASLRSSLSASA